MWSIVSSMKLLRKPSKRGEADIERNKGSTASLKDHSKEVNITHLDSDAQVNLDPSCSTVGGAGSNLAINGNIGKSATLGSTGAGTSGTAKVKVERRESARLASSATKFLRSLRSHSGSGKIVASSVIAADDKHPINVIALKELDIETHSLNPGAASSAGSSRGGRSGEGSSGSGSSTSGNKLPERSQSFNEKRLLVVTQNTSSEHSGPANGKNGSAGGQVKVKHSRAQSFVCNNSSSNRNKSGYSIYLNHHQQQYQSSQQNQANFAKQQLLFDQTHKKSTGGTGSDYASSASVQNSLKTGESSSRNHTGTSNGRSVRTPDVISSTTGSTTSSSSPRGLSLQSRETIYENLEVILEEKQNQEHMTNKSNIPCNKDYKLATIGVLNQSSPATKSKIVSESNLNENKRNEKGGGAEGNAVERCSEGGPSSKETTATSSSSESLEANMKISGKERPSQVTRRYNKDSGYETSCSDYSNIALPKSASVDSIINCRMTIGKSHPGSNAGGAGEPRSNRILNTSLYDELNVSPIREEYPTSKSQIIRGAGTPTGGGRKLRRSISEVPAERNTNLAKLQTKVGDSTARAMYTIANGLAVWTTDEKSSSSLGLNSGGSNSGSSQALHHYQSVYGCRPHLQLLQPHSGASIPGGFHAAIQQASVYSTLPRNHTTGTSSSTSKDSYGGVYRAFQYRNTHVQLVSSQQSQLASQQPYHNYHQIAAKSTPSLRNAVLQEHQLQNKCFGEPTPDDKQLSSSSTSASCTGKGSSPGSDAQQQHHIYQTLPIPTLSPARSTPNLGSTATNKLVQPRPIQQQHTQGSIPHLSMVSSSQQQVNDLGKSYPKNQHTSSHQKLYLHSGSSTGLSQQQSNSSSVLQLQSTNEHAFAEPARYPSTPNLQKCDSSNTLSSGIPQNEAGYPETQHPCNLSEGHNVETSRNATGSTNSGAMSSSNESSNWNSIDAQSILNNNNSAPARDPSSLKQIRYGPGHEKYPSWPIPVSSAQQIDPVGESHPVKLAPGSGSTRSKSWTEQTDYPKEKTPSYARPYMKRVNHSYTQQLKTVMEKCERIPPEAFTSQGDPQQLLHAHALSHPGGGRNIPHHPHSGISKGGNEGGIVPPPLLYRDLMCSQQNGHGNPYNSQNHHNLLHYYHPSQHPSQQQQIGSGEKDYMIPSPERIVPEKENTISKPLTQEDLELYTKKYEELMTQYPQSEGYHSYISSDSSSYISSGTPFLDQLRRESENNQQFWSGDKSINPNGGGSLCDPNDPLFGLVGGQLAAAVSGRDSVTTVVTNTSSNSSGTETLKWHGSTSDISLASGIGGSMHSGANTKSNNGSGHNSNSHSPRKGVASPPITTSASMLNKGWGEQKSIASSARLSTPQKQLAANADAMCSQNSQPHGGTNNLQSQMEQFNGSPSLSKWHSGSGEHIDHQSNSKNQANNGKANGSPSISSSHPNLKKFPLNTYTRPSMLLVDKSNSSQASSSSNHSGSSSSATSTPEKMAKLLQSLNTDAVNAMNLKGAKSLSHSLSSPVIDTSKPPSVAERILELEQQSHQQQNSASPSTSGTSSPKMGHNQHHSNEHLAFIASSFMKSSSLNNLPNSPGSMYTEDSSSQSSQQQNDWLQGNRANAVSPRGFSQSLSTSTVNKVATDPSSNNNTNMTYSYLDPDKKHKVADMTLKAIQKKALLSYYERHKGKCANTSSASSVSSSDGNSSQADCLEKDLCFPGKSNRLMLSLPKEYSIDQHLSLQNSNALSEESRNGTANSTSGVSSGNNNTISASSPTLTGISRNYRAISTSSSGVSSSSSSSSRSSGASNYKLSSQSLQHHHQLVHAANNNNSQKALQSTIPATGLPESNKQEKSESKQSTNSSTPDAEPSDGFLGSDSARLAYMSKYMPHLVNRDATTSPSAAWPNGSSGKLAAGGAGSGNGSPTAVTQEPAPIPPERPPKKPHLRNLAQQVHEESKDTKPPPPLPRAPVRPPATLNNGTTASTATGKSSATGPPPIPSKPGMSSSSNNSGGIGMTRSPSPDELPPPPPPPPAEELELLVNDEPLPPPPTVTEVDVIFGSRSRSVTGLSSCLHKDSYMAQRKERTLGYEGRYRRTLSPSGLGSNNSSKSSLDSASSPGASDSSGRNNTAHVGTGKLDSTLSPSAWEKFHNIRPPSTTVIFTSNELSKGVSSPPSSSSPSTSGSPQPPPSQPLFPRSISCDSNIFNNKTGASQSSIPPPVAQVAPLRGSSSSNNSDAGENSLEKGGHHYHHHSSSRNNVIQLSPASTNMTSRSSKQCDNDSCSPDLPTHGGENMNGVLTSSESVCEKGDRGYRDMYEKRTNGIDHHQKPENVSRSISFSNSVLPSVMVPPLQYEKDARSSGLSLNPNYSSESNLSVLKKSEVNLRVNCTSVVDLQSDVMNGNGELDSNNSKGSSPYPMSTDSSGSNTNQSTADGYGPTKGNNTSSVIPTFNSTASFYTGRQKTQEELECEELSRDIAKMLPIGDKLQTLLVPLPDHKTTADYMEGLFHLELKLQPENGERRGSQTIGTGLLPENATQEPANKDALKSTSPVTVEETAMNRKTTTTSADSGTTRNENMSTNVAELNGNFSHKSNGNGKGESDLTNFAVSPPPQGVANRSEPASARVMSASEKMQSNNAMQNSYRRCNGHAPLPADSAYFTTSESKAKFLTQYNKDIKKEPIHGTDSEELDKQKEELVSRISRKLEILRTEQLLLREEIQSNEQLGQMVVERVKQTAKRNEFDKFKLHVEEIEKITSLLLGISGRLARAENALMGLSEPPNPQEKKILESKRDKLREQLDEAKILKENIDRRSAQVSSFLQKYLTVEEYADYDHFVKMKAKLIIDAREIDDKIKLGEEQLGALKDALSTTTLPFSPTSSSS